MSIPQRLFFALWPSETARHKLIKTQAGITGRQVAPGNLHLTLAFIGPVQPSRVIDLHKSAEAVRGERIQLQLTRIEYWKKQRVAALVPDEIPSALAGLVVGLHKQLELHDFAVETRPFCPHVTLSRNVTAMNDRRLVRPVQWRAQHFVLVESIRNAAGETLYRPLHEWPLH